MVFNPFVARNNPYVGRGQPAPIYATGITRNSQDVGGVNYGTSKPQNINFRPSDVRSIANRSPMILVGWGFDKQYRPVPNYAEIDIDSNDPLYFLNHDYGSYDEEIGAVSGNKIFKRLHSFKGNVPSGSMVNPSDYIAGTVDLRYDYREGVWSSDHEFLAEILGVVRVTNDVGPNSSAYIIKEVTTNRTGLSVNYTNPFYNVAQFSSDQWDETPDFIYNSNVTIAHSNTRGFHGAFNIAQINDPIFNIIPSGTVVEVKPRRTKGTFNSSVADPEAKEDLFYTFSSPVSNSFLAMVFPREQTNDLQPFTFISTIPNHPLSMWIYDFTPILPNPRFDIPIDSSIGSGNPGILDILNEFDGAGPVGNWGDTNTPFVLNPFVDKSKDIGNNTVAFNLSETTNATSSAINNPAYLEGEQYGPGIDGGNIPKNFSLQPIRDGYIVEMSYKRLKDGNYLFWFSEQNAIDGECATE